MKTNAAGGINLPGFKTYHKEQNEDCVVLAERKTNGLMLEYPKIGSHTYDFFFTKVKAIQWEGEGGS